MASLRAEPMTLRGNFIGNKKGAVIALAVTSTATSGGSRPTITAPGVQCILCFAEGDNIIVEVGDDPTASETNGWLVPQGMSRAVPCENGQLISAKTYVPPA